MGSRSKPVAAVFFWVIGLDGGLTGAKGFCFNRLLRLREETCRSTGCTQERMSQSKLDVSDVYGLSRLGSRYNCSVESFCNSFQVVIGCKARVTILET